MLGSADGYCWNLETHQRVMDGLSLALDGGEAKDDDNDGNSGSHNGIPRYSLTEVIAIHFEGLEGYFKGELANVVCTGACPPPADANSQYYSQMPGSPMHAKRHAGRRNRTTQPRVTKPKATTKAKATTKITTKTKAMTPRFNPHRTQVWNRVVHLHSIQLHRPQVPLSLALSSRKSVAAQVRPHGQSQVG